MLISNAIPRTQLPIPPLMQADVTKTFYRVQFRPHSHQAAHEWTFINLNTDMYRFSNLRSLGISDLKHARDLTLSA